MRWRCGRFPVEGGGLGLVRHVRDATDGVARRDDVQVTGNVVQFGTLQKLCH